MKIVIIGPKAVGKTTIGSKLAEMLRIPFYDVDNKIEELYSQKTGHEMKCPEIYREIGEKGFRDLEADAIEILCEYNWCIISTGGGSFLNPSSRRIMRKHSVWVYLDAPQETLWARLQNMGLPVYLQDIEDPREQFNIITEKVREVLRIHADSVLQTEGLTPEQAACDIINITSEEISSREESPNTFGDVIRLTTFGESHGPMIGAVLEGIPPGTPLDEEYIKKEMEKRKPGKSCISTQRKESDQVRIVSGVYEGKATGTAIAMFIQNSDSNSSHYEAIKDLFRPGHADITFWKKYGIRDHRGGGRSSGRETAARVAGGSICKQLLEHRGVKIRAWTDQIGNVTSAPAQKDGFTDNPVRCPDGDAAVKMQDLIENISKQGDSIGGTVRIEIKGVPAGLGDPVFGKIDAELAQAFFSIGAVKAVEIGSGFDASLKKGSENNDQIRNSGFLSNNCGGILGGISTGQAITAKIAFKPTPSISKFQKTIDKQGRDTEIRIQGRHDPCIVPRAVPVVEAMAALVLYNAWERQKRINPAWATNIV